MNLANFTKVGLILYFFILWPAIFYGLPTEDDILQKIENSTDQHEKLELLTQLAKRNKYSNSEKSIFYGEMAIKIAQEIGDQKLLVEAQIMLGASNVINGELVKAVKIYLDLLSNYDLDNYDKIQVYNFLGLTFQIMDKHNLALEKAQKAVVLAEQIGQPELALRSIGNLGKIYQSLQQYDKSLHFFLKARSIATKTNDFIQLCYNHKDLSFLYLKQDQLDAAKENAEAAIRIAIEHGYNFIESEARINLSEIYRKKLNYSKAIIEAKKAIEILEKVHSSPALLNAQISLVKTKMELQNYDEALLIAINGLADVSLKESTNLEFDLTQLISKIYKKKGDFKNALSYSEKAYLLKEKISEKSNFESAELTRQMLTSQKMMIENELLRKEVIINQKMTRKSNAFGVAMAFFSFLLLAIGGILYRSGTFKNILQVSYSENESEVRLQFIKNVSILAILVAIPVILNMYFFKIDFGWQFACYTLAIYIAIHFAARAKKVNLIFVLAISLYVIQMLFPNVLAHMQGLIAANFVLFLVIYLFRPQPVYQIANIAFALGTIVMYYLEITDVSNQLHPFPLNLDIMLTFGGFLMLLVILFYFSKNLNDYKNQLFQNNKFLNQIADSNPHFMYAKNKKREFTFANEAVAETFGISKNELLGKKDEILLDNYQGEENNKELFDIITGYKKDDLGVINENKLIEKKEERFYSSTGEEKWFLTTKSPLYNDRNEVTGLIGVGIDITQRKLANEKLKESEQRYRQLFNMTYDGLIIINCQKEVLDTNYSARELFNLKANNKFRKQKISDFIPSFDTVFNLEKFCDKNVFYLSSIHLDTKDRSDECIPLEMSVFKIPFNGETQIACVFKNISSQIVLEKKELELFQKQQELEGLNNEIVSQVIFANTKNRLLSEIRNDVTSIAKLIDGKGKQELIKLNRKIGVNMESEETFFSFKLKFEKSHPHFFDKLLEIQPKLTNNDLKLCAYLRLGMTTQDIANLLFIERKSVEMSKYRLKKKLQPEGDLNSLIASI